MAMTGVVKDELSRVQVIKPCCRKAEVSTLLRFAGGLHLSEGRVVIEAELDTGAVARRLRASISEVFGHPAEFLVLAPSGLRKGNRYLVRVSKGQAGESLARQAGLIDSYGRPVRGLPRQVVSGSVCDCEAAWRGAFLAHGSLTEPGRSMALEITCPGSEAALALVGAARRLKVHAKARDVRDVDRVVIRDGRRGDRRHADQARRAPGRAGLGGAADAPRGPGHRQPAGQLRRRQPAPQRARRGGGRRARRARPGDPRPGRAAAPDHGGPAADGPPPAARPAWRNSASSPSRR